ncbi:MAG: DUF5696 domain-containing protein [Acholeplasmataceae bacterium]|nr:DUF5696 domain-containing protein [Acholeplasmataceae bacterium]
MVKITKYFIVFMLFSMFTLGIVYAATSKYEIISDLEPVENFPYINQLLLESSRYTQTDTVSPEKLLDYQTNYTLSYTPAELSQLGYELMFDKDGLEVYFEVDSFSLMVKNKETGYFWSSRPEFQGTSGQREDNTLNRNQMNSGLWVEYVRLTSISPATIQTQSLYTIAEVAYQNNGAVTEDEPDRLRPYMLEAGSYKYNRVKLDVSSRTSSSFTVDVNIKHLSINFTVDISMNNGAIEVHIPMESLKETGEVFRLLGIQVFPYFGAAREDKIPGYIVIPDGVGALVRTNARHNTYFQARFYNSDIGYSTQTIPNLSIPIYGIVHEPGGNAFYANILEGSENAQLLSTFWGSGTRYHRIGIRYNVRQIYRNIINKAGDGSDTIATDFTTQDYRIQFNFLSNQEASYVGIAKNYRDHLIEIGVLSSNEKTHDGNIPIQLGYIMSDQEPSFIGTTRVTMTTANQIKNAYNQFKEDGITNQQITLMGYSRDGYLRTNPYRANSWDKKDIQSLAKEVIADDNQIYLANDYVVSSNQSSRVSYNRDVARALNRLKMVRSTRNLNGQLTEIYFLYPAESYKMAKNDLGFIEDMGVSGLSMSNLGRTLFSYYDSGNFSRTTSISYYQDIAELYDNLLLSMPNVYMYPYLDGYLDMQITNSQYDYYTDLVPLLPIILKGSISYYTPYLNFNALAEDRFLTMVDFAINPSYILTHERTYEMRYTPSSVFYTTTLANYENEIVEAYHFVNDALKHVTNAYVVNREVLQTGLVAITYSNGVIIYVNYNYTTKFIGFQTVPARSYRVVNI